MIIKTDPEGKPERGRLLLLEEPVETDSQPHSVSGDSESENDELVEDSGEGSDCADGNEEEESEDDSDSEDQDEILDILLAPVTYTDENNTHFIQRVSREPPCRSSVIKLWEQLDMEIPERQARLTGICAIRRDLFSEAFDELIRQVTLDCTERGLLLARIKDEARMTISALQSLFHSATDFGATKAIEAETGKSSLEEEIFDLESRVENLESEVRRLEAWKRQVGRRMRERREVQMILFNEELECLQRSEQQYQILIETLLVSKNPV